jgi:hypothetical protein
VAVIRVADITLGFGRGKHEHGNSAELLMILDALKDLLAVHFGKVPVEKNKGGERVVSPSSANNSSACDPSVAIASYQWRAPACSSNAALMRYR